MKTPSNHSPNAPDPLAVALSKLDPSPHGFDWNSLMFAAGQASKARALNLWRAVAGVCAVAACGFAWAYFTRPHVMVDHAIYPDRGAVRAGSPTPQHGPQLHPPTPSTLTPTLTPVPKPEKQPETKPQLPASSPAMPDSPEWSFNPPPQRGEATRWLNMRNEVLTVGLSLLPDNGRKVAPPRSEQ